MFSLKHPLYLVLLLPTLAVAWQLVRHRPADRIRFASFADMPVHRWTWRILLARLATPLFVAALILIVFALARPQRHTLLVQESTDAVAIAAVLDVSGSMAQTVQTAAQPHAVNQPAPTRLDVVKACLADFIRQRPHDLIGLITFGGYAVTRAPLTADHDALLQVLDAVAVPGHEPGGAGPLRADELLTAIGDAMATACARLRPAQTTSKIIILLTDGGSNAGTLDPERATQVARRLGMRTYCIGVGHPPDRAAAGDDAPRPDAARLNAIADATGGIYFEVESAEGLARALRDIDKLEATRVATFRRRRTRDLFPFLLTPALGLLLITLALNMTTRRRLI